MLIGKNGIRREIDPKRFAEFKEKGYTELLAQEPPASVEEAPVAAEEVPVAAEKPPAAKPRKKG